MAAKKPKPKPDTADDVIKQLLESDDVTLLSSDDVYFEPRLWVQTDVLAFQACVGHRGVPSGRIIEIMGWEGTGKSTLLDQLFASYQSRKQVACLADTERSRQKYYTGLLGVNPKKLVVLKSMTIDGIGAKIAEFLMKLKASTYEGATLIGWDTVANTPSEGEFVAYLANAKKKPGDKKKNSSMMGGAKAIKAMFRAITDMLNETDTTLLCTNQWYMGPPEYRGGPPTKKTYGGGAMMYMPSIRIEVCRNTTKAGVYRDAAGVERGHYGTFKNIKNKIRDPHKEIPFLLIYGQGFDNVYTVCSILKDAGVISASSWSTIVLKDVGLKGDDVKWQNKTGLMKHLADNPKLWPAMVEAFWEVQGIS